MQNNGSTCGSDSGRVCVEQRFLLWVTRLIRHRLSTANDDVDHHTVMGTTFRKSGTQGVMCLVSKKSSSNTDEDANDEQPLCSDGA